MTEDQSKVKIVIFKNNSREVITQYTKNVKLSSLEYNCQVLQQYM